MSQTPFIPDIFLGFGGWGRQEAERILPLVDKKKNTPSCSKYKACFHSWQSTELYLKVDVVRIVVELL
jgi:hypothetical protein